MRVKCQWPDVLSNPLLPSVIAKYIKVNGYTWKCFVVVFLANLFEIKGANALKESR